MAVEWINSVGSILAVSGPASSGSRTTIALNTAGSLNGYGIRYVPMETDNLASVYFFLNAYTGTPGNMTVELRNSSGTATTPGSTVLATVTAVCPSAVALTWIKFTFASPITLTAGTLYWILVYNSDGSPATNFPTLVSNSPMAFRGLSYYSYRCYTTANGWGAGTLVGNSVGPTVLKFAGRSVGMIWTNTVNSSTNALRRGCKVGPFTAPIYLAQVNFLGQTVSNLTVLEIFDAATPPNGTPLASHTLGAENRLLGGIWLNPAFLIPVGMAIRVVFSTTGTSASVSSAGSEDLLPPADVLAAGIMGGKYYYCMASAGNTSWDEFPERAPRLELLFSDQGPATGDQVYIGEGDVHV